MAKSSKRYAIVIEGEPGSYSAYVPDLPGCVTVGETVDEVLREMQEVSRLMAKNKNGKPADIVDEGAKRYQEWRDGLLSDPETRAVYEEEAAKSELWLQLVEARLAAGLTQQQMAERLGVSQAQVARIEKRGYDAYTLNSLRKYVMALGDGFSLEVRIHVPEAPDEHIPTAI